jgi:hypothetical protein
MRWTSSYRRLRSARGWVFAWFPGWADENRTTGSARSVLPAPRQFIRTRVGPAVASLPKTDMKNSPNIMRIAPIVSISLHVLFMLFSGHELRATTHGEVMNVDIVPANEAPLPIEEPKPDQDPAPLNPQKPEAKPETRVSEPSAERTAAEPRTAQAEEAKPSQGPPRANEPRTAREPPPKSIEQRARQTSDREPPQSPSDPIGAQPRPPEGQTVSARDMAPDRLAAILGMPADQPVAPAPGGFSREPERIGKLTEGVKELKAQLNRCLVLPPGVARTDRIKMIIRLELTRDGALATDPTVIDGAAPAIGYPMMLSAIRALRRCAPYHLPADKYAD